MNDKLKFIPKTEEEWHRHDLELIENYRPMDDDFARELFRNNLPLAQRVIEIITGISGLELQYTETQYDLNRLLGSRSICLDVFGVDKNGNLYNFEIQRSNAGASAKRARYHSSALDIEFFESGEDFSKLPISYVIFITEKDVIGDGKLIYRVERIIEGLNKPFNDDSHIIFVNGAYNNPDDTSDLAKLVHDFKCTKADEMYIEELADSTKRFKETPKGVSEMCEKIENMRKIAMAQGREEGRAEGEAKGRAEGKAEGRFEGIFEAIIALVKDGLISVSEGAKRTNMSVTEFETKLAAIS